ncbi:MAG: hypothetical protein KUL86_10275 [Castellaniella sp.]|nr:hypothetical protein [Castellaniella sp.]
MTQYAKRAIDITINQGNDASGKPAGPDIKLSGLRAHVLIQQLGGGQQGVMQLQVFGLPLSMINDLTRYGMIRNQVGENSILLAAGDVGGPMSTAYTGVIQKSVGVFEAMPDVPMNIIAYSALIDAIRPVPGASYSGGVDVATVMADLAKQMNPQPQGLAFDNHGVSVMLSNPHLKGTILDQIRSMALAANINFSIENGTLVIWPKLGHRREKPILVSPETGMVGYPSFGGGQGIIVNTLYMPTVHLGSRIEIRSSITPACGIWTVYGVTHELESETPNGQWFTQLMCYPGQQ